MERSVNYMLLRYMVLSAVFAALIAVGAWLRFDLPFSPVPITLQTLFVLLAGLLLPPVWAFSSLGLYLFAGIIGLPVFAGGTRGFAVILGPSGGFLIGFLIAAVLMSLLVKALMGKIWLARVAGAAAADRGGLARVVLVNLVAVLVGTLIIYACGYPWIVLNLGWDWRIGLARAVLPYIPGDILKIIAAMVLAPISQRIILRNA